MKNIFLLIALLFGAFTILAQVDSVGVINGVKAKYPGGDKALQRCIVQNIAYPEEALIYDVAGTVYLSFVIDTFGKIIELVADSVNLTTVVKNKLSKNKLAKQEAYIKKLNTESNDYGLILAAKNAIRSCPDWKPAWQDGVNVNMRWNIPVKFQIF
jgi:protein TonB